MNKSIESYRPYLFTIAYNILAQVQEAEDIVQETFVYYLSLTEDHVQNPKSYLSRVVTNKAINRLKELKKQRESYPGVWLPEPYVNTAAASQDCEPDVMSLEVLSALETLNPVERAIFVLREGFNFPYSELAAICGTTEVNSRKILSRCRKKITLRPKKASAQRDQVLSLMNAFLKAVVEEDLETLTSLLKEDIVLYSDGGGKAAAALKPLWGREVVMKFLMGLARKNKDQPIFPSMVIANLQPAFLLSSPQGPETLISFDCEGGNVKQIFIIRNPDKLSFS